MLFRIPILILFLSMHDMVIGKQGKGDFSRGKFSIVVFGWRGENFLGRGGQFPKWNFQWGEIS